MMPMPKNKPPQACTNPYSFVIGDSNLIFFLVDEGIEDPTRIVFLRKNRCLPPPPFDVKSMSH